MQKNNNMKRLETWWLFTLQFKYVKKSNIADKDWDSLALSRLGRFAFTSTELNNKVLIWNPSDYWIMLMS